MTSKTIYEAVGGDAKILELAHAWHERCMADPIVSHAFSHGFHPEHSLRLAKYWAQSLGGPDDYGRSIADESFVVRLHAGHREHQEMDDRAEVCFAQAMDDAGIPIDETLRTVLKAFFHWGIQRMNAYPESADDVPPKMAIPLWSWEGPVRPYVSS